MPKYKMAHYAGSLFIHIYEQVWGMLIVALFSSWEMLQNNK